jgi:hypothetical protein
VEAAGQTALIALAVPLDQAVEYGDMLIAETGHLDLWTRLARSRPAGMPSAPAWSEYEEWPRGRVMFDRRAGRFVVRADRQLHRAPFLAMIAARFGFSAGEAVVVGDEHYRSVRVVPVPQTALGGAMPRRK